MYVCMFPSVCARIHTHTHLVYLLSSPNTAGAYVSIPNLEGIYIDR
jgi:hypothetical protein